MQISTIVRGYGWAPIGGCSEYTELRLPRGTKLLICLVLLVQC